MFVNYARDADYLRLVVRLCKRWIEQSETTGSTAPKKSVPPAQPAKIQDWHFGSLRHPSDRIGASRSGVALSLSKRQAAQCQHRISATLNARGAMP